MTLPFYPFYWSDYNAKTIGLTKGQHGAYILLLKYFYCTGRRVLHEQRYSIALAMLEQDRSDTDTVLGLFFVRDGDEWIMPRAEEVMSDWNAKHEKRVNAGKASKTPPATPEQCSSNASVIPEQPEPEPEPIKKDTAPDLFEGFWMVCPKKVGKGAAKKFWKTAILKTSPETIIAAMKVFAAKQVGQDEKYIPHPATWLNAERWQDADLQPATQLVEVSDKIVVLEGTAQWDAWKVIRPILVARDIRRADGSLCRGWYMPSEWPPGYEPDLSVPDFLRRPKPQQGEAA